MKTSNIIIIATIIAIIGGYFFDAFRLRNKFLGADFSNPYYDCGEKIDIPSTKAIYLDTTQATGFFDFTIIYGNKNQIITRDSTLISYKNTDTGLVICNRDPRNKLFIMLTDLEKVKSEKDGYVKIKNFKSNDLEIILKNKSYINIENCIVNNLSISSANSSMSLDSVSTVRNLNLQLKSGSSFNLYNNPTENSNYDMDNNCNITLHGKAATELINRNISVEVMESAK